MFQETSARSILKTISWRIVATLATIILVFVFTHQVKLAIAVGFVEVIVKLILYFFHERSWNKINFGRKEIIPFVLWFTGLPFSGKDDVANKVYEILKQKKYNVQRLSSKKIRSIFPEIGFSKEERNQHVKRIGFLASILEKHKVIVIASFVSPYREARGFVKDQCDHFIEVYMDALVQECRGRDTKGLYKKAEDGEIKDFTGVNSPYEIPEDPEIILNLKNFSLEENVNKVIAYLDKHKFLV